MQKELTFKIQSQKGLILKTMLNQKNRWFLAGDFCNDHSGCPFIGYKAPTRIAELQKEGLIVSRWSKKTTALGTKLKEYKLSKVYFGFIYYEDGIEDQIKFDKTLLQNNQLNLF
jgi:hypothetical protein